MTNGIILENINREGLQEIIQGAVRIELSSLQPKKEDQFKTRKEMAEKLRISLVTLDKAVRDGKLKAFRLNGRILFRDSELNLSEIPIRKRR